MLLNKEDIKEINSNCPSGNGILSEPNGIPVKSKRELKQEYCIECNKFGVKCKNLCPSCYSKKYRQTPTGKNAMTLYNSTKGRIAQKKYTSKNKRVLKQENCKECNKFGVFCKNLCPSCYSKKHRTAKGKGILKQENCKECNEIGVKCKDLCPSCYSKKYRTTKGKSILKQENCKECNEIGVKCKNLCPSCYYKNKRCTYEKNDIFFNKVLKKIAKGYTIQKACKLIGIDTSVLYRSINDVQKKELMDAKLLYKLRYNPLEFNDAIDFV